MAFYLYKQTNANGLWQKNMPYALLIEAETSDLADEKLVSIGGYFGYDCECCDSRWKSATDECDPGTFGYQNPSIYYADGRVVQGDGFWDSRGVVKGQSHISLDAIAIEIEVIR